MKQFIVIAATIFYAISLVVALFVFPPSVASAELDSAYTVAPYVYCGGE